MSNLVEVLWSKKFLHKCDFVCSLILIFPYKALLWAFLWNEWYSVRLYIPGDIWWSRFKQLCCWFTNLVKNVWKVSRLRIICSQAYILTFKMDSFCHSFLDSCPFPVKYQPRQKRPCVIERTCKVRRGGTNRLSCHLVPFDGLFNYFTYCLPDFLSLPVLARSA